MYEKHRHLTVATVLVVAVAVTVAVPAAVSGQVDGGTESFAVDDLSAPDSIAPDETLVVAASVTNPNDEPATQQVAFRLGGSVLERRTLTLDPGENTTARFNVSTDALAEGANVVGVYTQSQGEVARVELSESFVVDELDAPANATVGDEVVVNATVSNPNGFESTQPVEFRLDGDAIAEEELTLGVRESASVSFTLNTTGVEPGTFVHSVFTRDDGAVAEITLLNATEPSENASVTFEDQNTTGASVTVANATLPDGGFVAVLNESGGVIGATGFLENGTNENVTVELFEPLANGTSAALTAQLHRDTNDNEALDFLTSNGTEDTPYLDANGTPVTDTATVTVVDGTEPSEPDGNASVTFEDQNTTGASVTVANATLPDGGFVAVLNESGGVIGATGFLENGTNENVTVELFEPLANGTSAALTAQLHRDTNGNETLDFLATDGAEDVPYEDEFGDPVADAATVTVVSETDPTEPPTNASVTFENQTSTGVSVTVSEATLPDGGFVAVLDADGSVVGASDFLANGTGENVTVPFLEPTADGENGTFTAQLHRDTDGDEILDFLTSNGTEDTPYLDANGTAVTDDATVTFDGADPGDDADNEGDGNGGDGTESGANETGATAAASVFRW